jgi:hypothetical protein
MEIQIILKISLDFGAPRETRTPDPLITNQMLYQLSYRGTFPAFTASGAAVQASLSGRPGKGGAGINHAPYREAKLAARPFRGIAAAYGAGADGRTPWL